MKVTVKTQGLRELEKALMELPRATARKVAQRALLKAAQPVVDRAKALVPVRTGNLRKSIKAKVRSNNAAGKAAYAAAMKAGAGKEAAVGALRGAQRAAGGQNVTTVDVGPGQQPHAHMIEFGTQRRGPQPYLRPSWDENKQKVLDSIGETLGDEIMKTAQRAARKALKGGR